MLYIWFDPEEAIEEVSKYFDHFVSNICTEVYEVMNGRTFTLT